jgi:hypothetical protein
VAEWLEKAVQEHTQIIHLVEAKKGEDLGAYFRNVHWNSALKLRYVKEAFDINETTADSAVEPSSRTLLAG